MKLPSKIKALATQDVFAAGQLAARGKVFSEVEEILWDYYYGVESLRAPNLSTEMRRGLEEGNAMFELLLCKIFVAAVTERNPAKVFEIAEAVAYLKKQGDLHNAKPVEPTRALLLFYKPILERARIKHSYEKLAKLVGYKGGMDQFRRMVRELNVLHRKEAGGKPKNTPTHRAFKFSQRSE
jgi:hypothetical protein